MHATFKRDPQYCVYRHSLDGEVFYIGAGRPMRPFETSNRNPEWCAIANARQDYKIDIIAWFDDRESALALECAEIKRLKPRANNILNPAYRRERKRFFSVCDSRHDYYYRKRMIRIGMLPDIKVSK